VLGDIIVVPLVVPIEDDKIGDLLCVSIAVDDSTGEELCVPTRENDIIDDFVCVLVDEEENKDDTEFDTIEDCVILCVVVEVGIILYDLTGDGEGLYV
jgi:hypothetical protein